MPEAVVVFSMPASGMRTNYRFQGIAPRWGKRRRTFVLTVVGLLGVGSAMAASSPRVLVLSGGPDLASAASLAEALRIQLGAQGGVSVGDALVGSNLPTRIQEARAKLSRTDAALAVWVEQEPSSRDTEILLFAVLRESGRILGTTVKTSSEDRSANERMLAVKVAEILRGPFMAPTPPLPPPAPPAPPAPCPEPAALPERQHTWLAGLGLWGAWPTAGTGMREGLLGEVGWRWVTKAWAIEGYAGSRLVSTAVITDAGNQLTLGEGDVALGARVLRGRGRFSFGAGVEVEGWVLRAEALAAEASGTSWHMVPALSGQVDLRVRLGVGVAMRLAAGAAFPLRETRFVVGGREYLDYGHVRPMTDLSLIFSPR
jgi:hypothetical protein